MKNNLFGCLHGVKAYKKEILEAVDEFQTLVLTVRIALKFGLESILTF